MGRSIRSGNNLCGWAAVLVSLALLLFPARSADRKKSLLPFGRHGGIESSLLNAPRLSSLFLGFASRLSCSLGSFSGRSICGLACCSLASDPLSFRDPDVAGGDDLRARLYSTQPSGVFRTCPCTFNLGLLCSAGSIQTVFKIGCPHHVLVVIDTIWCRAKKRKPRACRPSLCGRRKSRGDPSSDALADEYCGEYATWTDVKYATSNA